MTSSSGGTSGIEQVLNNAAPASSDIPLLDASDPRQMTNSDQLNAQIEPLKWLNSNVSNRNAEYQLLILEIARLQTMKSDLEAEVDGAVFVR
ncbi:MAG: hypothetical protein IIB28_06235 [Chloroflexi bacterium]|nr:hypothetical protein [Chloroflexota bacterium]